MKPPIDQVHKVPILFVALAFMLGILAHQLYFNWWLVLVIGTCTVLAFISAFSVNRYSKLNELSVNVILPILISTCGYATAELTKSSPAVFPETTSVYKAFVTEKIKSTDHYSDFLLELVDSESDENYSRKKTTIQFRGFDTLQNKRIHIGQVIYMKGALKRIENTGNPGSFDFKRFMAAKSIYYQLTLFSNYFTTNQERKSLQIFALKLRDHLIQKFNTYGFSKESMSILSALTLGDKTYLSSETKDSFANSGAMHILAVSGLHVGILFVMFQFLFLKMLPNKRLKFVRLLLVLSSLWFYALITGFPASVLRATIMFSVIAIGSSFKRTNNIYNSIGISALLLMVFRPTIIYEVGFQLSYIALISIVYFQPKIEDLLSIRNTQLSKIWKLFSVSVAAQIGTVPITLFYFHQFPVYFWLSNLIVIPFAGILLYASFLFFVSTAIPIVAENFGWALNKLAEILGFLIEKISFLPHSVLSNIWIEKNTVFILYVLVLLVMLFISFRNKKYIFWILAILVLLQLSFISREIKSQKNQKLIVYKTYEPILLSFITGQSHYYFTQKNELTEYEQRLLRQTSGFLNTRQAIKIPSKFVFTMQHQPNFNIIRFQHFKLGISTEDQLLTPYNSLLNIQLKYKRKNLYFNNLNNYNTPNNERSDAIYKECELAIKNYETAINKAIIIDF